jgi:hypothetical protein
MEENTTLKLECLFCKSTDFIVSDKDYVPQPGEQIRCANCGRTNDYDSLMRVVKRKGADWAEEQATKGMDDFAKKLGKIFK